MHRLDVMRLLDRYRGDAAVVAGPGATSGMLWASGHRAATIYNMEFGYSVAVALGIALALPGVEVVALEGDGSAAASLGTFATVGRYAPANLVVIVFDNGVYGTGGGTVATVTGTGTDLTAVARACGIPADRVLGVSDEAAAESALASALGSDGPWVLVVRVEPSDVVSGSRPTPTLDHVETAYSMRSELAARAMPVARPAHDVGDDGRRR
jgi:thiamine pyrophosphate-dependent acetolactate synthase large subunit-like protein